MPPKVQTFTPGNFITIEDVMTGVRKFAQVTQNGQTYVDSDADDVTHLPIRESLKPENVGNMLAWGLFFVDREPKNYPPFSNLCKRLINSGEGFISYNRAAYWAFVNRDFDYMRAMLAANQEAQLLAKGHQTLDALIDKHVAVSAI